MIQKKMFNLLIGIAFPVLLNACTVLKHEDRDSSKLTVTGIHSTVVAKKTSVKELEALYGEPDTEEENPKKAVEQFNSINNDEGSVNVVLEDNTDYWATLLVDHTSSIKGNNLDGYYEYQSKELAGLKVFFFIIDDTVRSYRFSGNITDTSVAQKDKYLRQILD
ncbi:hypothetical protein [Streptococcus pluranimalium]|uniref:Uncharacterized protein n=1 Tax=Streptococcus pluranimalium TaxID=82348 RepID=A0A2L0D434_9STRE|nr:hypothetical protein [Streptococcus pluranimalium]AUW96331.1 hypothetical protein C0J00_03970 [Streptococcus pluranimalium]